MHIMIATDGSLDVDKTVTFGSRLAGADDTVTVYTAVEVPRGMLADMRDAATQMIDYTVEYRTEQAETSGPSDPWIGDDAVLSAYIGSKVKDRTSDLVAALEAAGLHPEVVGEEGENAATSILAATEERQVDVLCIGTRGAGLFDGLLGSISTKITRLAPCPVLLIR
jgi:nucleotide-binding universal stress UspA family protein